MGRGGASQIIGVIEGGPDGVGEAVGLAVLDGPGIGSQIMGVFIAVPDTLRVTVGVGVGLRVIMGRGGASQIIGVIEGGGGGSHKIGPCNRQLALVPPRTTIIARIAL